MALYRWPHGGCVRGAWHQAVLRPLRGFLGPGGLRSPIPQCLSSRLCGAWTLHPSQIGIARRVFTPDPAEVAFARRILEAMPDGTGAVMVDGKMQDDATWKQAKVMADLSDLVAAKDGTPD